MFSVYQAIINILMNPSDGARRENTLCKGLLCVCPQNTP